MKQIKIDIGLDGGISIDAVGFSGPDCEEATRFMEQALGETVSRRHKPEYRRRTTVRLNQELGNGGAGS
ncbi:MAG: DUF2997 domain-containing protein [Lentisphaerae bacterium]|jgi:hypothetical protein|nr:DUF2997 domain-containing protein [Lentisphaerota bacterium]MBT4820380.1 DUF2997 domain-containing protein [Lentisphaerota bacterium]MBT5606078.1 DUF2997 domain-containing protein [Lentisphaerota bacterium]MBT7057059.1 DUF2997 domain-containing protein [Lentisphaerota bacterium]MBT7845531.1 DUF2997 domain-containing protein [Lentisphaerota bacterium]